MSGKVKRAQYTLEFKLEAVRLVRTRQSMAAVAATLNMPEQTSTTGSSMQNRRSGSCRREMRWT